MILIQLNIAVIALTVKSPFSPGNCLLLHRVSHTLTRLIDVAWDVTGAGKPFAYSSDF